jgi:PAS domain S-box-containing protein
MKTRARTVPSQAPSGDERFRTLVEGIQEYAVFLLDGEGRVMTWNLGAQLITGYEADEIVGRPVDLLYTPDAIAEGLPRNLLDQAKGRGRVEQEGWRLRKNGTRFWAEVAITCLTDNQGNRIGYATIARDLTERRLAESERARRREVLLRLEERFRLLVESVEEYAIFMLDPHGIVTTWNIGAERIKGYTAGEVLGRHFSVFRTNEDVRSGACDRELFLAAQNGKMEEEGWRVRKDGSHFWANVVLTAIRDGTGTLIGFAKITRDLTQRRALEEERLQRARAEEAVRLREEFLLIASHELKTPLSTLQLDLYGIEQDLNGDRFKVSRKIDRANRSVARLSALVESLLSVSRLAQGKLTLNPASMDLAETVVQVAEGMREQADKAGCDLTVQAPAPILGSWDRLRIEQVVVNLLVNAIKYAAGGTIEIEVRFADASAVIEISDHGPGVAEADLLRIFQRFERASSIRHYGGLGLGLYVAREIVEAHGGSITASNRPGGGAKFAVRLPADRPSPTAQAATPEN